MKNNPNYRPRMRNKQTAPAQTTSIGSVWKQAIRPHITKKRVIIALIVVALLLLALPVATYAYFARDIADRDRLMNRNNTGIVLKDRNNQPFYSSGVLSSNDDLSLDQISDNVEKAIIASEDQNFYEHNGFSATGIAGALFSNIKEGSSTGAGGSTITQQLVKNKLLSSRKNYIRKYQEVSMAVAVERRYEKKEILEMYLNSVYFGEGAFGISDAAQTYFSKKPADLSLSESTMLAGLLPAPSAYSPVSGSKDKAKTAQNNVLRKMVDTKQITSEQREDAFNAELTYASGADKGGAEHAQHFAEMVIKDLQRKYGEERVARSGFEVITTLDLNKQKEAEAIIREQVAKTTDRGGRNSGTVAIDPTNGHIIALVGSVDYYNTTFGQVNMALARRQPGSSFKPIYYSEAMAKGLISPATIFNDTNKTYGGNYTPKNYDNRYKGKMAVRNALAESRNIPAIDIMQKLGINNGAKAAERMGIDGIKDPQSYGLSLALGTAEVQLFDMVNAYAAFANKGMQYDPVLYTKINDKFENPVDEIDAEKPKRVLSEEAAFMTSSILSDSAARAPTLGTSLNISGKNPALKTGTTNDNRDAWTIGYTPTLVVGVWLGNNENEPMRSLAGGSGAGATWKRIMTSYLKDKKREEFVKPDDVIAVTICSGTESRAVNQDGGEGTKVEFFLKSAQPKSTCNERPAPKPDTEDNQENDQTTDTDNDNRPSDDQGNEEEEDEETPPTTTQPAPTQPTQPTQPTSPSGGTGGGRSNPGTPRN